MPTVSINLNKVGKPTFDEIRTKRKIQREEQRRGSPSCIKSFTSDLKMETLSETNINIMPKTKEKNNLMDKVEPLNIETKVRIRSTSKTMQFRTVMKNLSVRARAKLVGLSPEHSRSSDNRSRNNRSRLSNFSSTSKVLR